MGRRTAPATGLALPVAALDPAETAFGSWLAGFVAAEGHFGAHTFGRHRPRPVFSIAQRNDNLPALWHLRERLGIGRVHPITQGIGHPASMFTLSRTEDAERLIALLRAHPLPEASPKTDQLDAWAELTALTRAVYRRRTSGDPSAEAEIRAAAARLAPMRTYSGRVSLCQCASPGESPA